jgi:hypothetical protein
MIKKLIKCNYKEEKHRHFNLKGTFYRFTKNLFRNTTFLQKKDYSNREKPVNNKIIH